MKQHTHKITPVFGVILLMMLPLLSSSDSKSIGGERQDRVSNYDAKRAGGGNAELTFQEAYELNFDTPFPGAAGHIRLNPSDMFVLDGNMIHLMQRQGEDWQLRTSFDNGAEVLDIQEGTIRYQLLALDRAGLKVVDFLSFDQPEVLGTFPVDNSKLARGGHLIERFGGYAYVVDGSIGGFKVFDVEARKASAPKAEFSGSSGAPADIQLRNTTVYLLTPGDLLAVRVGDFLDPKPEFAGRFRTSGTARSMGMNDSYAFIADGSRLTVLNIDADSQNFLRDESTYDIPFQIGNVIVRDEKMYLLGAGGSLQVLRTPGYDR